MYGRTILIVICRGDLSRTFINDVLILLSVPTWLTGTHIILNYKHGFTVITRTQRTKYNLAYIGIFLIFPQYLLKMVEYVYIL